MYRMYSVQIDKILYTCYAKNSGRIIGVEGKKQTKEVFENGI